jgi:hypothetical protein
MRLTISQAAAALVLVLPAVAAAQETCAGSASSAHSAADDPFARHGWHLELAGQKAYEAWNYNISYEEMQGFTVGLSYGLRNGVVLIARSPLHYVSQSNVDAYLIGATVGLRTRIYKRRRASIFLEFEVGISEADTAVPPRGTRFTTCCSAAAARRFACAGGCT